MKNELATLAVPIGVVGILLLLVVPMPAWLLDSPDHRATSCWRS